MGFSKSWNCTNSRVQINHKLTRKPFDYLLIIIHKKFTEKWRSYCRPWSKQLTRTSHLRTLAPIFCAHPYCARNSCRNAMLHQARARAQSKKYIHMKEWYPLRRLCLDLTRLDGRWPLLFLDRWFSLLTLDRLRKKWTKNQCRKFKIFPFFDSRDIESRQLAAARVCKFCRLKIRFILTNVTSWFY